MLFCTFNFVDLIYKRNWEFVLGSTTVDLGYYRDFSSYTLFGTCRLNLVVVGTYVKKSKYVLLQWSEP